MIKRVFFYLFSGILALAFLGACLLLPAHLALQVQKGYLNEVSVQIMSVLPTEKPPQEEAFPLYNALALLYLRDLHGDYVNKLAAPQGYDLQQAEQRFGEEYTLLLGCGFPLKEDYTVSRISLDAYASAANGAVTAELLSVWLGYEAGTAAFIVDAKTGKILKIEQYFAPSESQRLNYDADARAFAEYLDLGDIVFTGEDNGAYNVTTYGFYADADEIHLEIVTGASYTVRAYPGAVKDGGAA